EDRGHDADAIRMDAGLQQRGRLAERVHHADLHTVGGLTIQSREEGAVHIAHAALMGRCQLLDHLVFGKRHALSSIRIRYIMELSEVLKWQGIRFRRSDGAQCPVSGTHHTPSGRTAVAVISILRPVASSSFTTTVARTGYGFLKNSA